MSLSLSQDFHFTHSKRAKSPNIERGACERGTTKRLERNSVPAMLQNNSDIIMKKPAEINFSGLSSAKLASAHNKVFTNLCSQAAEQISDKSKVNEFVVKAFNHFVKADEKSADDVISFVKSNSDSFELLHKTATEFVIEDNKKKPLVGAALDKAVSTAFSKAVNTYKYLNEKGGLYTNKQLHKFLEMAEDKVIVFSSLFAIGLTCLLRPAAIMALPGDKKHADDKKYASAHSIASGIIGYVISSLIFGPISSAVKKAGTIVDLKLKKDPESVLKFYKNTKALNAIKTIINMSPEALFAAPRAVVTVALIPPILKYVFGWEKKSGAHKDSAPILNNYAAMNFKGSSNKKVFQNFMGGSK